MKTEATAHAEEDKKRKDLIEAKNLAENLIYTSEKALKEAGNKVPEADKKEIETKISELKDVSQKDDIEQIKAKSEALSSTIQKIGQAMYGNQKTDDGRHPPAGEAGKTDEQKTEEKPEEKKE